MISPETLRFFPFFAGQDDYMLKEIAYISEEVTLGTGEWLFHQDEAALHFFVVLDGAVSLALAIYLNGTGEKIEKLGSVGRGETLGWSSLVNPYIYTMGAHANSETHLIKIKAGALRQLMEDNPKFGYYLLKNLIEVITERLDYKCIQLLSLATPSKEKTKNAT
jgi:CRP-like cAMP-binding protein